MTTPAPQPQYSEKLLIRIMNDCTDVQDLANVGQLYKDLAQAGDIRITQRLLCFARVKQQELIYGSQINNRKNKN